MTTNKEQIFLLPIVCAPEEAEKSYYKPYGFKSWVWNYFSLDKSRPPKKICGICKTQLSDVGSNTSSLRKHLSRRHGVEEKADTSGSHSVSDMSSKECCSNHVLFS